MLSGIKIIHNEADLTDLYLPLISEINLTDEMGLTADTLSMILYNADLSFLNQFAQGDKIEMELEDNAGRVLKTGVFYIDQISGTIGPESTMNVSAISAPSDRDGFKKKIRYTRRRVDLQTVLKDVLKKSNIELVYRLLNGNGDPWQIELKNARHTDQTVGEVLDSYAKDFGCLLKIHDDKVIFGPKIAYNFDAPVLELTAGIDPMQGFSYDLKFSQYTEFEIRYYDPKTGVITTDKKGSTSRIVEKRTRAKNRRILNEWRNEILFPPGEGYTEQDPEQPALQDVYAEQRYFDLLERTNQDAALAAAKKAARTGIVSPALKQQLIAAGASGLIPLLEERATAPKWKPEFENEIIRSIYERTDNVEQARAIALAVDSQDLLDISFETTDDARLIAAHVMTLNGLDDNFNGNYLIKTANHIITPDGWTVSVRASNLF